MVGQGVLRECLLEPNVALVQTVGRSATGVKNGKLREIVRPDLLQYADIEGELQGFDACFFCLGVSAAGMPQPQYERLTYGITMAAAETLARINAGLDARGLTFVYVSGAGTDSSEKRSSMWARVKGKTENALMRLPFKGVYIFRPGVIQPMHGATSKTAAYRMLYTLMGPVLPVLRRIFPRYILTTEEIGRAMILVATQGAPKRLLESWDIRELLTRELLTQHEA